MKKFLSILLFLLLGIYLYPQEQQSDIPALIREDNPGIEISNNTMVKYDSIKVFSTPNIPTIFKNVRPKDDLNARILFDKNNLSDGAYTIQIYKDGKIVRHKSFGYYTNGKSLNRKIKVIIEPDTLKVSFK